MLLMLQYICYILANGMQQHADCNIYQTRVIFQNKHPMNKKINNSDLITKYEYIIYMKIDKTHLRKVNISFMMQ